MSKYDMWRNEGKFRQKFVFSYQFQFCSITSSLCRPLDYTLQAFLSFRISPEFAHIHISCVSGLILGGNSKTTTAVQFFIILRLHVFSLSCDSIYWQELDSDFLFVLFLFFPLILWFRKQSV